MKFCGITEPEVTYDPQVNCTLTQDMVMSAPGRGKGGGECSNACSVGEGVKLFVCFMNDLFKICKTVIFIS